MQDEHTNEPSQTFRITVQALEDILGRQFPVLDHGFVRVLDYMGGDAAIVQAARVSYGRGTKKTSQDRALIRYLLRHRHTTPFEMCEIKFHVKLPIFVARQWIRHRTANVNEYSARYSVLDKEFYVPDRKYIDTVLAREKWEKRVPASVNMGQQVCLFDDDFVPTDLSVTAAQSATDNQGRGELLEADEAAESLKSISKISEAAYAAYLKLLNEDNRGQVLDPTRAGVARELARIVVPTNYYTQWYWKIDLHNLLHFLALRTDHHAQFEIRAYAAVIGEIVGRWVPITWEAFMDYGRKAVQLSAQEVALVNRLLAGDNPSQKDSGLSEREWREFCATFGLDEPGDRNGH